MQNIRYKKESKGFVLSLVLWITAALMLLSLLFIRMNKEDTTIHMQLHQKLLTELKTQSLFERLSFYIATAKFHPVTVDNTLPDFPPRLKLDASEYNITDDHMTCTYSLLDHSKLFNLRFLLTPQKAQNLIQLITSRRYPFADIYLDWIDKGDKTRINGAEKNDYLLDRYAYTPANYISFQHKDALFLLKGFDSIEQNSTERVLGYFTTYGTVPVNIMLLDRLELQAFFPQYDTDEIDRLMHMRTKDPKSYKRYFRSTDLSHDYYSTFPSKVITLDIACRYRQIRSRLKAIVDFRATNSKSMAILELYKY